MKQNAVMEIGRAHPDTGWMVFRQTGSRNRQMGKSCEDVTWIKETPQMCFYGLADGQSGAKHSAQGAHTALVAVAEWIQHAGIPELLAYPFPDELPCMIMQTVRRAILSLCRNGSEEFRDYASTLLAMAVHPETGQYVLIHLGDGCAIEVKENGPVQMLSGPENGSAPYHTWLTTSDNAVAHFRLRFGSVTEKKRLILITDGIEKLGQGKNILQKAKCLLAGGTQEEIINYLATDTPVDDASCIVVDWAEMKA